MDDYTKNLLTIQPAKTTYSSGFKNADGKTIERQEGKPYTRKTTITEKINEKGEVEDKKIHEHDDKYYKPHHNWGRHWMGYQEAILKMVEHAKMDFKVFNFLLGISDRFNVANNIIIKDISEALGVSRQTISKSLRFLREEDIVHKVKGAYMINPFLVTTINASNDDIVAAQMLWDREIGHYNFYGEPEDSDNVMKIIKDIKNKNRRKQKSEISKEAEIIKDGVKSHNKTKSKERNEK